MSGSATRKKAWLVACASLLVVALTAPAARAVVIGPSDINSGPFAGFPCTTPPCAVSGVTGSTPSLNNIFKAPFDAEITELRVRSQAEIPIEIVQMDLTGTDPLFDDFFNVGITVGEGPDFITTFPLDPPITVPQGAGLGLRVGENGGSIDLVQTPGENGVIGWDPSLGLGESGPPNSNFPGGLPAFQMELKEVPPPPPVPTPPELADISVVKTRITKRRPGIGGAADFKVLVTNNGPSAAKGVVLYDTFDEPDLISEGSISFPGPTGGPGGGACAPGALSPTLKFRPNLLGGPSPFGASTVLRCPIGNMAPGQSTEYFFFNEAGPLKPRVSSKVVRNYAAAEAGGGPPDPYLFNNFSEAEIKLRRDGCRVRAGNVLTGNEKPNRIRGTKKNDAIYGLGKNDRLWGNKGNDCIFGGEGNDMLVGNADFDRMYGGEGKNFYNAVDGKRDLIFCDSRRDRGRIDSKDRLKRKCRSKRFKVIGKNGGKRKNKRHRKRGRLAGA